LVAAASQRLGQAVAESLDRLPLRWTPLFGLPRVSILRPRLTTRGWCGCKGWAISHGA